MREVLVNYLGQPKAHQKFNQDLFLRDCAGTTMCRNWSFNSVKWNSWVFTSQPARAGSVGPMQPFFPPPLFPKQLRRIAFDCWWCTLVRWILNSIPRQINNLQHLNCCSGGAALAHRSCSFSGLQPLAPVDDVKHKPACSRSRSSPTSGLVRLRALDLAELVLPLITSAANWELVISNLLEISPILCTLPQS